MNNLIEDIDILDESKDCFLTYTEEVLTDRAVPSAEDGLLSVHRKLLWTMEEPLKMNSRSKFKKSASIVGTTLATSYFHGDQACYGALCKIAQPYLMRYPLVEGDGNLGTQEGNGMEAASRYCVVGDTLIPTDKGLKKIKDIAKNVPLNSEQDISLVVRGKQGEEVLAEKIVNSGEHTTCILTLANNQNIQATTNHPLMVLNDSLDFAWKTAGELQKGDKVLYPLFEKNNCGFGKCNDLYEAAMLGCMISEGYATVQNRIGINNKDMDMIIPVMKWIALNWGENLGCLTENKERGYYEYSVASKENYPTFVELYEFGKSIDKKLPQAFFEGTRDYQSTCLSYLFEGDGSVDAEHGISYSSISEELIRQLQLVLQMNFGIFSSIGYSHTRKEIKLRINKASSERFKNQIGFISEKKKARLDETIQSFQDKRWANNNLQCLQEVNSFLRKKYSSRIIERYNFSHLKNINKIKEIISEKDYNRIVYLLTNYITVNIVDKQEVLTKEPVYCFTINNADHAFIGNGLINHNTNARPSVYADLMMTDFKKNIVPLKETYNGEYMEPVVLPSLLPNAIVNGRETIAIGLAHNSLPHNLTEVCNALIKRLNKNDSLTTEEILEEIKGPDFPLGNIVINAKDIKTAFATGHSSTSLKIRGDYEIQKGNIIFTSIPYRTYRNKIKEQITKAADELDSYIEDFSDESNVGINRLVFKVKKGINPEQAVLKLFALTDLQTSLSYNMNYIVNGTPKMCSMSDLIDAYINHQINIIIKTAEFDKDKAKRRAHILEGLVIVINNIDKAIELIRGSENTTEAKKKLVATFDLSEEQAKAVLDMKLARLTKLDKNELINELEEKKAIIAECDKLLTEELYRNNKLIEKISKLKEKYGDKRRTQLLNIEVKPKEKEIAEVIPEDVVVVATKSGLIKKIPRATFKVQRKGGKGIKSQDDTILDVIKTNTIDTIMIFSSFGKMYRCVVDNIPTGTNATRGVSMHELVKLETNERVVAISSLHRKSTPQYIIFITKNGMIKKSYLEEYTKTNRNTGISALKVKENDEIINIIFQDEEDMLLITKNGMSLKFATKDIAPIGRVAMGVKGIKLADDDELVAALPIHKTTDRIAVFTSAGLAKKVELKEFPLQARGGRGTLIYKPTETTGAIVGAVMVSDEDNILISGNHSTICISAKEVPLIGKQGIGNIMIKNNRILSVTKI